MTKTVIQLAVMFVVLVLVQAVVFNHVCLYNVALAFVFIYFIVKLPISLGRGWVITLSFLLGTAVDILSDTPGMNALACTLLGALRMPVLRLYVPRDDDAVQAEPSVRLLGVGVFLKYIFTLSLLYCILVFAIEAFTFFNIGIMLMRIICSALLTTVLLFGTESLTFRQREKRL